MCLLCAQTVCVRFCSKSVLGLSEVHRVLSAKTAPERILPKMPDIKAQSAEMMSLTVINCTSLKGGQSTRRRSTVILLYLVCCWRSACIVADDMRHDDALMHVCHVYSNNSFSIRLWNCFWSPLTNLMIDFYWDRSMVRPSKITPAMRAS